MPNARKCEKGTLSNLVKSRGEEEKPRGKQVNWYNKTFQENFCHERSSLQTGTEK